MSTAQETSVQSLNGQIDDLIKSGVKFGEKVHKVLFACLEHASTYGDWTPLVRCVKGLANDCAGVVDMAAVKRWIHKNSPVRVGLQFDANGKAVKDADGRMEISGKMLKKDEPGYTPFDLQNAAKAPATSDPLTKARIKRDMGEFNINYVKGIIAGAAREYKRTLEGKTNKTFSFKADGGTVVPLNEGQIAQLGAFIEALGNVEVPSLASVVAAMESNETDDTDSQLPEEMAA